MNLSHGENILSGPLPGVQLNCRSSIWTWSTQAPGYSLSIHLEVFFDTIFNELIADATFSSVMKQQDSITLGQATSPSHLFSRSMSLYYYYMISSFLTFLVPQRRRSGFETGETNIFCHILNLDC